MSRLRNIWCFVLFGSCFARFYPEKGREVIMLPPSCVEINFYCSKSERLNSERYKDIESCLNWCRETKGCRWISFYFAGTQKCYLHNGCAKPVSNNGYAIAPLDCPIDKAEQIGCFEQDVKYRGHSIATAISVEDHRQCQLKCLKLLECEVWTYSKETRLCDFKALSSRKYRQYDSEYVSGPKDCQGDHLCFYQNQYYNAKYINTTYGVQSTEECCEKCNSAALCSAFSFYYYYDYKSEGICYQFKEFDGAVAQEITSYEQHYYRSGLKNCNHNFQLADFNLNCRDYYATLVNKHDDREKHLLYHARDALTRTCEDRCRIWNEGNHTEGSCAFYEHDFMLKRCWLFSSGVELSATFGSTSVIGRVGGDCDIRKLPSTIMPRLLKSSSKVTSHSSTGDQPNAAVSISLQSKKFLFILFFLLCKQ